jgi:uncharacterized OsmC-like protein
MTMRYKSKKRILRVLAIGVSLAAVFAATSQPLRAQATHTTQDWAQTPPAFDNGDSLRDFEARLRSSLFLLKAQPEINEPLKLTGTVTAIGRTGIRRLRIRNFQLLSDGGRESGESNLAAGSWPSVVGALGSALAGDYLVQAAVKGIPIDDLELIFTAKPGTAPSKTTGTQVTYPRNLNYIVFITSPATDAQLEDLRKTVERVSPVFHLVTDGQKVDHGKLTYTQTPLQREGKTLDGLREFLAGKYASTQGATPFEGPSPKQAADDWRQPLRADIRIEGGTGIRHVRTDIGNFQVIHDYPRYLGGHNLGPVPEEDILGRMITCLTHIYEIEASKRQVKLDGVELKVEGTLTSRLGNIDNPPLYKDIAYNVSISSPETKETIEALQKAVESICPIYNLIKDGQPVNGVIVRGPYTEEKEKAASPAK